jgi:N-acetylglucosamine kinase-like BadF-type ATPase
VVLAILCGRRSPTLNCFCTVPPTDVAVGLDAGGSSTTVWVRPADAKTPAAHDGPAAHPKQRGVDDAAHVLGALVREATRPHRPVGTLAVCAGVAGAGRAAEQDALSDPLWTTLHDAAETVQVEVRSDAAIALDAAFGADSGIVVIAGTGSMVLGRTTEETLARAGGWGHRLGDPGSGHALGRAGLRAVADALDGGPETRLRARVAEAHDIDDGEALVRRVVDEGLPLADVAPTVLSAAAAGDDVASSIVEKQADALAQRVGWLVGRADSFAPRVALAGGLTNDACYAERLGHHLREQWPDASVRGAEQPPVAGALRHARRLLDGVA